MSHALDVVREPITTADTPVHHPLRAVPACLALAGIAAIAATAARDPLHLAVLAVAALVGALLLGATSDAAGRRSSLARAALPALIAGALIGARLIAPDFDLGVVAAAFAGLALGAAAPAAAASTADLVGGRTSTLLVSAAALTGVLAGVLAPLTAVLASAPAGIAFVLGVAETVPAVQTPRLLLPLGVGVVASHRERRVRATAGSAAGAAAAAGIAIGVFAPFPAALVAVVLVIAVAALGIACTTAATPPDRGAEPAAHVLVGLTTGAAPAAAAVALLPGVAGAAAAGLLAALLALGALAGQRRPASTALVMPGRRAYRAAVTGFERSARPTPDRAAIVRRADDLPDAIGAARSAGLRVATFSTGHAAASLAALEGAALLRVDLAEPVSVDPERRLVRVPAGTPWGVVASAVAPYGLAVPHGSSPHVGVVGYLLRGGLSFYGRAVGVAANLLESIELVDAGGNRITVDREHDPELFWALRGGGGGYGIVTAVTVRTFPVTALQTGAAIWSIEHASALLERWEQWSADAPREASTSFRVMRLPGLPGVPRELANRPIVTVDGVVHSGDADARERVAAITDGLLAPLRAIAQPLLDSWRPAHPLEVKHTHMDPTVPIGFVADHLLLGELGPVGREALLDAATGDAAGLDIIELRQLGGAFAERPENAGVVGSFDAATAFFASGGVSRKVGEDAVLARLQSVRAAVSPWDTGFTAPTFATDRRFPQRSFDPGTASRVDAVRRRVDPDGVFRIDVARGAAAE